MLKNMKKGSIIRRTNIRILCAQASGNQLFRLSNNEMGISIGNSDSGRIEPFQPTRTLGDQTGTEKCMRNERNGYCRARLF
jgi:hypothetical protein